MNSTSKPYSAREAIAAALRAYQSAGAAYKQRTAQANADRQRASLEAQKQRDTALAQARATRDRGKQQAQQATSEVENMVRQANSLLSSVDLGALMAAQINRPTVVPGPNLFTDIMKLSATAKSIFPQFRMAVEELERKRKTFLSRLKRALRLPP